MKNKNPLYVVKGKTVLEASGILDLVVKKLNLTPVIEVLSKMLSMLMDQVKDYPTFLYLKKFVDSLVEKLMTMVPVFKKA
jgi:hypothetical protein